MHKTKSNLKLAVCQLYNPVLHGIAIAYNNPEPIYGHYLALDVFSPTSAYNETPYGFIEQWNELHRDVQMDNTIASMKDRLYKYLNNIYTPETVSDTSKIYANMFDNDYTTSASIINIKEMCKLPKVDIVETLEIDGGYTVAIKKTFWLCIFQRMLKKRYRNFAKRVYAYENPYPPNKRPRVCLH